MGKPGLKVAQHVSMMYVMKLKTNSSRAKDIKKSKATSECSSALLRPFMCHQSVFGERVCKLAKAVFSPAGCIG